MSQDQTSTDLAREALFAEARAMGLEFSNNIGTENLRLRILAAKESNLLGGENQNVGASQVATENTTTIQKNVKAPKADPDDLSHITDPHAYRTALIKREKRLIRCVIENLDPRKSSLEGEIFCVSNELIGNIKMFVPYGEITHDGWHIPYCIFKQLRDRQFQNIRSYTDRTTKQIKVETNLRPEFSLRILPPLTEQELADLRSSAAGQ